MEVHKHRREGDRAILLEAGTEIPLKEDSLEVAADSNLVDSLDSLVVEVLGCSLVVRKAVVAVGSLAAADTVSLIYRCQYILHQLAMPRSCVIAGLSMGTYEIEDMATLAEADLDCSTTYRLVLCTLLFS